MYDEDSQCMYCGGKQFKNPGRLRHHLIRKHPVTDAAGKVVGYYGPKFKLEGNRWVRDHEKPSVIKS